LANRVVDLLAAILLVGVISLCYGMLPGHGPQWHMLAIAPLSIMWGFLLAAGVAGSPWMIAFPLATMAVLVLACLALRYVDLRPVRVILVAVLFGVQLVGAAYLVYFFRIIV
jgi:hypothetical protein